MLSFKKGKFSGEPTSCNDLRQIGHYLNGYYLVKQNENTGTVFCHFKEPTEGEGDDLRLNNLELIYIFT